MSPKQYTPSQAALAQRIHAIRANKRSSTTTSSSSTQIQTHHKEPSPPLSTRYPNFSRPLSKTLDSLDVSGEDEEVDDERRAGNIGVNGRGSKGEWRYFSLNSARLRRERLEGALGRWVGGEDGDDGKGLVLDGDEDILEDEEDEEEIVMVSTIDRPLSPFAVLEQPRQRDFTSLGGGDSVRVGSAEDIRGGVVGGDDMLQSSSSPPSRHSLAFQSHVTHLAPSTQTLSAQLAASTRRTIGARIRRSMFFTTGFFPAGHSSTKNDHDDEPRRHSWTHSLPARWKFPLRRRPDSIHNVVAKQVEVVGASPPSSPVPASNEESELEGEVRPSSSLSFASTTHSARPLCLPTIQHRRQSRDSGDGAGRPSSGLRAPVRLSRTIRRAPGSVISASTVEVGCVEGGQDGRTEEVVVRAVDGDGEEWETQEESEEATSEDSETDMDVIIGLDIGSMSLADLAVSQRGNEDVHLDQSWRSRETPGVMIGNMNRSVSMPGVRESIDTARAEEWYRD